MAKPRPKDWTKLRDVIEYVESLGPGWTVFKDQGDNCYGFCKSEELLNNVSATNSIRPSTAEIWDVDKHGVELPNTRRMVVGLLEGKLNKRFVIHRT